jgi:5'-phosphate synthase pdxT subunit
LCINLRCLTTSLCSDNGVLAASSSEMAADRATRIGVLALQGSFREHMTLLARIPGVQAVEVRTKAELESCAGLIIPGKLMMPGCAMHTAEKFLLRAVGHVAPPSPSLLPPLLQPHWPEYHPCLQVSCAGGESTTMALVAERWGLIPELQQFAAQERPIWGTCAGLIFLANRASGGW